MNKLLTFSIFLLFYQKLLVKNLGAGPPNYSGQKFEGASTGPSRTAIGRRRSNTLYENYFVSKLMCKIAFECKLYIARRIYNLSA